MALPLGFSWNLPTQMTSVSGNLRLVGLAQRRMYRYVNFGEHMGSVISYQKTNCARSWNRFQIASPGKCGSFDGVIFECGSLNTAQSTGFRRPGDWLSPLSSKPKNRSAAPSFSAIPATSVLASLFQLPRKPSNDFTTMKPNLDKIDDAVLALLYLTSFTEGKDELALTRAWKSHDWDALDRLHKKGLISDPKKKAKSVVLSQEGRQLSEELFRRLFCE